MKWVQLCSSLNIPLALPFFGVGMKTDLFQSCGHCGVFQICWHIECSPFMTSSFRIWNSSTGIPSLPLALFVVMLPKAHLTSHSRLSGSRWVITPSWSSESWLDYYSFFLTEQLFIIITKSCHIFYYKILLFLFSILLLLLQRVLLLYGFWLP